MDHREMATCTHRASHDLEGLCARCEDAAHDRRHPTPVDGCFACKVGTIDLHYTYGRDQFHGATLGERIEKQEREAAEMGVKAEPVGSRWI